MCILQNSVLTFFVCWTLHTNTFIKFCSEFSHGKLLKSAYFWLSYSRNTTLWWRFLDHRVEVEIAEMTFSSRLLNCSIWPLGKLSTIPENFFKIMQGMLHYEAFIFQNLVKIWGSILTRSPTVAKFRALFRPHLCKVSLLWGKKKQSPPEWLKFRRLRYAHLSVITARMSS